MHTLLLQDPYSLFGRLSWTLIGLAAVAVAGYFTVMRLRRAIRGGDEPSSAFTLEDLRRLRRDGRITEEEYERARGKMIARTRSGAAGGDDAGLDGAGLLGGRKAPGAPRHLGLGSARAPSLLEDPAVAAELAKLREGAADRAAAPTGSKTRPPPSAPSGPDGGASRGRPPTEITMLPEDPPPPPDGDPTAPRRP